MTEVAWVALGAVVTVVLGVSVVAWIIDELRRIDSGRQAPGFERPDRDRSSPPTGD